MSDYQQIAKEKQSDLSEFKVSQVVPQQEYVTPDIQQLAISMPTQVKVSESNSNQDQFSDQLKIDQGQQIITQRDSKLSNENTTEYPLSKYRFLQIFLYIISDFSNSLSIFTFQTIASQISKIYDIDPFLVSLNLSFYSLLYPFVSILSNYIIDHRGPALAVRIGVVLTLIGMLIRLLIEESWGYILLSCVFCGAGGPLIFNAKCSFQANWFHAGDLPQITTLSTILTSCNGIIGVLLPGFYFTGYDYKTDTSKDYADGKKMMKDLLVLEVIISGICVGISLVFLRDKPKRPPSFVSTMKRENFKEAVKGMIKNSAYIKLNIASMLLVANTSTLGALFSFAIEPWGFNQTDTTYCAAGMVVTGIIGSAINAPLLRKYKNFKKTTIILALIMLINVIIITGILNLESRYILVLFVSLFGGGYQPLVSTTYEYACEVVFPIGEGSAQGFLLATSAIFGFVCITVFGAIVKGENKAQTYILLSYMIISIVIGIILIKTSSFILNRFNTEVKNFKKIHDFNNNNNIESPQKDLLRNESSSSQQQQNQDQQQQQQQLQNSTNQHIMITQQNHGDVHDHMIRIQQTSQVELKLKDLSKVSSQDNTPNS